MNNLKIGDTVMVIDNKRIVMNDRIMLNYATKQDCLKWSYNKRPSNGFKATVKNIIDNVAIIADDEHSYVVSLEGIIVKKPKFITIQQFYDFAVKNGVENCAFGISITGDMQNDADISDMDTVELLEKFSLDNININGKYYEHNEAVKDNFVWVYLKINE